MTAAKMSFTHKLVVWIAVVAALSCVAGFYSEKWAQAKREKANASAEQTAPLTQEQLDLLLALQLAHRAGWEYPETRNTETKQPTTER